jgi:hypothetical protein
VQLLQSIFIGWIILLSRVKADYSGAGLQASVQAVHLWLTSQHHTEGQYTRRRRKAHFMKPLTIVGILLIVLGIIGYATGGISFTHQKKDVDLGPVQISHKTQDTLPLSPILSTVALVAGLGLVVVGAKAK